MIFDVRLVKLLFELKSQEWTFSMVIVELLRCLKVDLIRIIDGAYLLVVNNLITIKGSQRKPRDSS